MDEMGFLVASGRTFAQTVDGGSRAVNSDLPNLAFAADVTAPTTNRQKFAGVASATNNIQTTDTITWNFIVTACAFAKRQRIKPMRWNGKEGWAVVLSPEQARDLKQDPNYQTNVGRAATTGNKNPLFSGYFADIDGIVLFEHPKVCSTIAAASGAKYGASGTVDGAQALLLGAQAMGFARIHDVKWVEDEDDDYENRQNVGVALMLGYRKPVYTSIYTNTSEDFSVVSLYSAAAQ
jgi:N4-gp56 family major capsid protein